jgi:hypothetical protein
MPADVFGKVEVWRTSIVVAVRGRLEPIGRGRRHPARRHVVGVRCAVSATAPLPKDPFVRAVVRSMGL